MDTNLYCPQRHILKILAQMMMKCLEKDVIRGVEKLDPQERGGKKLQKALYRKVPFLFP